MYDRTTISKDICHQLTTTTKHDLLVLAHSAIFVFVPVPVTQFDAVACVQSVLLLAVSSDSFSHTSHRRTTPKRQQRALAGAAGTQLRNFDTSCDDREIRTPKNESLAPKGTAYHRIASWQGWVTLEAPPPPDSGGRTLQIT